MIVYKAENIITGKTYIGCTTNTLEYRRSQHFRDVKRVNRPKTAFIIAISEYGENSFVFTQIDEATTIEELYEKEEYYIKKYKSLIHENGYNLTTGGKSGKRFSTTKKKIGSKKKESWEDPEIAKKMLDGLTKATDVWVQMCKDRLVEFKCETCGKIKLVPPHIAKKSHYCCHKCVPLNLDALIIATEVNIENRINKHKQIKETCLNWCYDHQQIIEDAAYNKVSTDLNEMIQLIFNEYDTKDLRTISAAVCGTSGNKKMLKYLKECVKIYAEPDQNLLVA